MKTRCCYQAAALAVLLGCHAAGDVRAQFFHSSAPPEAENVLLQVRISQARWLPSPCVEDARAWTDTLYLRVRVGDAFMVDDGAFRIATLDPRGEVRIELPVQLEGLFVEAPPGETHSLRVRRTPVAVYTSDVVDAGATVEFSVVDTLPAGAREGMRTLRNPLAAYEAQKPTIVETRPAVVPKQYHGPWGTVRVLVTLDDDGSLAGATVEHSVSRVLDSAALTAARHYQYRLGVTCRGNKPIRSLPVDFPFNGWRR